MVTCAAASACSLIYSLDGLEGTVYEMARLGEQDSDHAEEPLRTALEPRAAVHADTRPRPEAHATDLAERDARIAEPAPLLRLERQRSGER